MLKVPCSGLFDYTVRCKYSRFFLTINVINESQLTQPPGTCNKLHPRGLVEYNLYEGVGWGEGGGSFQLKGYFYANKISLENEPSL